jgi:predicted metal-dependent enzyme (double-stranded beta helix superfamily)
MTDAEEPSDAVGTRVLFENEVIRVWDFTLEPGQVSQLHRHQLDYFFIYVTPDNRLEVRVPGETPDPVHTRDGYVSYTRVGSATDPRLTHQLANVGEVAHRQILIEFLQAPGEPREGLAQIENNGVGSDAAADRRKA